MIGSFSVRNAARDLGVGRALHRYWHAPIEQFARSIREGGPWEQKRTAAGRRAMMEAAARLVRLPMPLPDRGLQVSFLSGREYWHQTLFCFYSLQVRVSERITPVLFDDGTLSSEVRSLIERVVPWTKFVPLSEIEARLERALPTHRFPTLRARRLVYPHLRKLTDVHAEVSGWSLVLDSDMLFFRRPDAVMSWLAAPAAPIYMQDVGDAYGYSRPLMRELSGRSVPSAVNVGLYGIRSDSIDWERMEFWCRMQIEREGPHYLQEQALTALLLAGTGAKPLSRSDYVVMPSLMEGKVPRAVLHHYVAHSKRAYYQYGWRQVIEDAPC